MRRTKRLLILLLLAGSASATAQRSPVAVKVLGAQGIVWVLDYRGQLHRLGERDLTREPLDGKIVDIALAPSGAILVLRDNHGEFGGGLLRVNLRSGRVTVVERRIGNSICAGPLNRQCDPVTATLTDPDDSRCVLASVGLWHFSSHGRILRVCGDSVAVFFERPCPPDSNGKPRDCSEAVFGLAADTDGFVAILGFSVIRFRSGTIVDEAKFPRMPRDTVPVRRSFAIPGTVLVWTNVNAHASISGPTPLVAVRR